MARAVMAANPEQAAEAAPEGEPVQERVQPPRRRRPTVSPKADESVEATMVIMTMEDSSPDGEPVAAPEVECWLSTTSAAA